ncbi:MAG TPA: exodeoxyribonuclease V subunit gamma, partial [Accumulibacter sp.]|nr:exodeoxyribonuclease V subunit gamma [Accumulibacter sp.]
VEMLTTWHTRGGHYRLRPCAADAARRHLGELLTLYRDGLCQPLPFFPKSAWAYVNADDNALAAAQRAWHHARHFAWGEEADPAYQLAWRGVADPLDERFVDCAQRVFTPLLAHLEEVPR